MSRIEEMAGWQAVQAGVWEAWEFDRTCQHTYNPGKVHITCIPDAPDVSVILQWTEMTAQTPFLPTKCGAYYHREIPTRARQR